MPVSGSVKPAHGTLVILVGSSDEDYMLAKPILMFWESFYSCGEPGKFSQISY
jgi:3-hydroxyisobutyrate dehydrogenase